MKSLLQKRLVIGSILLAVACIQLRSFRFLTTIHAVADESHNYENFLHFPFGTGTSRSIYGSLEIPINPNSTIMEDVSKIWHDPDKGSICVHLKQSGRCPYPALLGRLSGSALAMLDWQAQKTESDAGVVHCGDYSNKWLDAGDYFVEILILYCEDFGVGALERVGNKTGWLEAGFKSKCVEDSMRNRITAEEGSKISISSSRGGRGSYRLGRWIRRPGVPLRPLFTRHQPVECTDSEKGYRPLNPLPEWCEPLTNRDKPTSRTSLWNNQQGDDVVGLPEYEFQWRMNISEEDLIAKLRKRQHDVSKDFPKICAVGDSHSRLMLERSLPQLRLSGIFEYIKQSWIRPYKIAPEIVDRKCDQVFMQIGQWAPSWYTRNNPYSFAKYHDRLKKHIQKALKVLESKPGAKIYLPTIDQNPLMGRVNACNDWRTPTVLDSYSFVNQMIKRELNMSKVEYIDINFIIYTHWDGHPDW
mmetsp:Transcript_34305/g.83245  ORF Transcript_34305/g.83245 Transcript_34305/m.83245 type:complete len:472 (-) Transcript_34305:481-1896(-)